MFAIRFYRYYVISMAAMINQHFIHLGAILNFLCGKLLCWLLRRVSVVYFTSSPFAMLNHHIVLMIVCAINN